MAPKKGEVEKDQLTDCTKVGFFEAESDENLQAKKGKKMKMVKIDNFSNRGKVLPEQGSWHLERKKQILEKHPEVRKLIGPNPWTALIYFIPFTIQMLLCNYVESAPFWQLLLISYTIGCYLSSGMGVLGHEGAHGLVFTNPRWLNKLFACIAFTPVFMGPFGNYWSVEHMYHHQVVVDKMNRYGPQHNGLLFKLIVTLLFIHLLSLAFFIASTALMITSMVTISMKLIGMRSTYLPTSFPLPPYKNFPQIISKWFFINQLITNGFFIGVYLLIGPWAVLYLYLSISWGNSLHPLGMRQVQEHYLRKKDQPTNSVYGLDQWLVFNIGFHNEHHDFPNIPWNRLPKLHKLAPEFYDSLFYYNSYNEVLSNFLFDKGIPTSVLLEGSIFDN